jgi:hypothetical protein
MKCEANKPLERKDNRFKEMHSRKKATLLSATAACRGVDGNNIRWQHAVREWTYLARVVCSLVDIRGKFGRIIIGPLMVVWWRYTAMVIRMTMLASRLF